MDDTPASLESARLALDGLIAEVIMASSGAEALHVLQRKPEIDAVISDIMMPGMSGIELAEEIARQARTSRGVDDRLQRQAGSWSSCVVASPQQAVRIEGSCRRPDQRAIFGPGSDECRPPGSIDKILSAR